MSIHCLCYDTALVLIFETFSSKFLARRKNMYPLGLVELFAFRGTGKPIRCWYSPGLNLYGFQISRTLVDAQSVIQQPMCLNMACAMHEANLRQTLLGG